VYYSNSPFTILQDLSDERVLFVDKEDTVIRVLRVHITDISSRIKMLLAFKHYVKIKYI